MARVDFSLPPKERAVYGATVTARASSGETITLVRTGMTALEAMRSIAAVLDALDDDFRVVSVSTPNSIERDLFANRLALDGDSAGYAIMPEIMMLGRIGRTDLLHTSLDFVAASNARRPRAPVKHRER
jgi:hypothetical protein